eukprot:scaffold38794_cov466-Skeletonema_dohrnii-CCMP3373.AAC.1
MQVRGVGVGRLSSIPTSTSSLLFVHRLRDSEGQMIIPKPKSGGIKRYRDEYYNYQYSSLLPFPSSAKPKLELEHHEQVLESTLLLPSSLQHHYNYSRGP